MSRAIVFECTDFPVAVESIAGVLAASGAPALIAAFTLIVLGIDGNASWERGANFAVSGTLACTSLRSLRTTASSL